MSKNQVKAKLIAATYKTNRVNNESMNIQGGTHSSRERTSFSAKDSPTSELSGTIFLSKFQPSLLSSLNGSNNPFLRHSVIISSVPSELHLVETESSSAMQEDTKHCTSSVHLYVLKDGLSKRNC